MMTFKDLKKLVELPSYKEQRVPTVKALEVSGVPVVTEKVLENHGSINVYQNGYVIYRAHKRVTVFSLRDCVHYKYDAAEGAGHHIEEAEFDDYEWHIRLVLEGEDRIFMNYEIIQGKWMPSREDREYKKEILEGVDEAVSTLERMISEERVEELLSTLTDAAKTKQDLDSAVFQTAGIAQKFNCTLNRLDYMQEQGLMSSLPLANNLVPIKRALTTTSTAIFVPFTTQELFMEGDSLYYGLNAVSNNMIMADRKQLKNPNGLILGTPGSGKSFSAKREMTNVFFTTTDDIIIADPEGEYYPLVEALGGQVIHISSTSRDYINPMDINLNYADDDNPLGMKSDFILSLCELIMGARDGMEPEEKSVIDRCLPLVYQKYLNDPKPENMPILGDLYDCLREQKERQAQRIATALEIYVNGSLRVFNHQTNVELDNRLICFDIKELGKQLKKLGMLIVQDQVWNRVTINRNAKKNTRYYIDEFHLLLKEEQTAAYSVEIWKRFRKWGGIPTGITQNIKDLLASREIENIFENSDFIYMLNQASGDRQILAKQLNISPFQLSYVTNSNEGEGLLFYGNTIIPFKDKFDTSLKLYGLMTTKPNEIAKYREKKDA